MYPRLRSGCRQSNGGSGTIYRVRIRSRCDRQGSAGSTLRQNDPPPALRRPHDEDAACRPRAASAKPWACSTAAGTCGRTQLGAGALGFGRHPATASRRLSVAWKISAGRGRRDAAVVGRERLHTPRTVRIRWREIEIVACFLQTIPVVRKRARRSCHRRPRLSGTQRRGARSGQTGETPADNDEIDFPLSMSLRVEG